MSTLKQQEANRRNALKSTGPCTVDGKNRSRRNALKHGLAGEGIVLPHQEAVAVEERMAEWHSSLKPFDPYEMWLLGVIAVESVRVDRCRVQDRILRHDQIHRSWESRAELQRQSAEELAAKLHNHPSLVAKLSGTVAGSSLLLDRWRALSRALENGGWTPDQEILALDLLGTPAALREGAASPLDPGSNGDLPAHFRHLAEAQIQRLERLKNEIHPARDARLHELAVEGLPDLEDRSWLRLQRYEARCFRRLAWATQQMKSRRVVPSISDRASEPKFPKPVVQKEPEPRFEPEPSVDQRPALSEALTQKDYAVWAEISAKVTPHGPEPVVKNSRKDLPLAKDRPSLRASKAAKGVGLKSIGRKRLLAEIESAEVSGKFDV